jgi:hypothetical protein
MSDTDPLAHERFRTILTDAVESTGYDAYANGLDADPDVASSKVIGLFPEAYFEHRTNDAGVRVRRVVVASEWEVDPEPASLAPDGKPWLNPLDENEAESYYDRSSRLTAVREADPDVRD